MANKHTYEERYKNYRDHKGANLTTREELLKRGVKKGTPNLPMDDWTFDGPERKLKEGDKRRKADLYLDQITRAMKGK